MTSTKELIKKVLEANEVDNNVEKIKLTVEFITQKHCN